MMEDEKEKCELLGIIQGKDTVIQELKDKIADIKANCDLAIEGRDIKIKELEQELTVQKDLLQEETNLHLHAEEYIKSLEKENAELKERYNKVDIIGYDALKKLTKAKELIEKYMLFCKGELTHYKDIEEQAEQFIKEIEK